MVDGVCSKEVDKWGHEVTVQTIKDQPELQLKEASIIKAPKEQILAEDCPNQQRMITIAEFEWTEETPFWQLATHKNCVHNELRACLGRVITLTPPMDYGALLLLKENAAAIAARLEPVVPIASHQELVDKYLPQKKRKLYQRCLKSLQDEPLSSRDWLIKAFVKSEKLKIMERDGDPRMIQARSPRFNVELGLYTRAVEKNLYHLMDPVLAPLGIEIPLIAKGMNLRTRAQVLRTIWEQTPNPVSVSFDLSRWDKHVSVGLMEVMHQWYLQLLPCEWLRFLLSKQVSNKCITEKGLIRYNVTGGVMSGDMTTALGNCVAVIVILLTYRDLIRQLAIEIVDAKYDGCRGAELVIRSRIAAQLISVKRTQPGLLEEIIKRKAWFRVLDDGDDHVLITSKHLEPVMSKTLEIWWQAMGHSLKIEGTTDKFHMIEFCQHKPHWIEHLQSWVMMPSPWKVIPTSCLISSANIAHRRAYLKTVWSARAYLHEGMPLVGPLFYRLANSISGPLLGQKHWEKTALGLDYQLRASQESKGRKDLMHLPSNQPVSIKKSRAVMPTAESRVMAWEQWGVTPTVQEIVERMVVKPPKNRTLLTLETAVKEGRVLKSTHFQATLNQLIPTVRESNLFTVIYYHYGKVLFYTSLVMIAQWVLVSPNHLSKPEELIDSW